jgi:adenylate kinase
MENSGIIIIMLGPPGAGKGTQARMISEALKLPHVSTGDMMREAVKLETALGLKVKSVMNGGALVPDDLVDAIVAERLNKEDCQGGVILDGYPRSVPQAEYLNNWLGKANISLVVIGITVDDNELIKRLSSRWTCPQCGKMFNALLDPSKAGGKCDECNATLIQRKDDAAQIIAERLAVYKKTTQPVMDYYKGIGAFSEINGDSAVNGIFDKIMALINEKRPMN